MKACKSESAMGRLVSLRVKSSWLFYIVRILYHYSAYIFDLDLDDSISSWGWPNGSRSCIRLRYLGI
jgi:hypothetical protein